jgi:hypothetical protein
MNLKYLAVSILGTAAALPGQMPQIHEIVGQFPGQFVSALVRSGDLNDDGVPDYWIQKKLVDVPGAYGRELISGRTGLPLLFVGETGPSSPLPIAPYGPIESFVGDANGDGYADFISRSSTDGSRAVVSGKYIRDRVLGQTPTVAPILFTIQPAAFAFTGHVEPLGDINGDGGQDFGIATSGGLFVNSFRVVSGMTGATMYTHPFGQFLNNVEPFAALGDVNNDGYPDFSIGVPGSFSGAVDVYSGEFIAAVSSGAAPQSPQYLATIVAPPLTTYFGELCAGIGDVDGDGVGDLAVASELSGGTENVHVYSCATFQRLYSVSAPMPNLLPNIGNNLLGCGDVNGDGTPDWAVSSGGYGQSFALARQGVVAVYDGADGSEIFTVYGPVGNAFLGADVIGAGDLTSDGMPDLVASQAGWNGLGIPRIRAFGICGARSYGSPISGSTMSLAWRSHGAPAPASGAVEIDGATPFGVGALVVGDGIATSTLAGLAVYVDVVAFPYAIFFFGYDFNGRQSFAVNLFDPALDGIRYYAQAFELTPLLRETNGLEVLFSN